MLGRFPRFVAACLVLLPLGAAARAGEVANHLTGKVVNIQATENQNLVAQLATLGVQLDATAQLTIEVESTTPGHLELAEPHNYMSYPGAVTDLTLSVGTWEAHLAPPPGLEFQNFVSVANDAKASGGKADSWGCAVIGVDTDMICSAGEFSDFSSIVTAFIAVPPKASKDDGLVQDLSKYGSVALLTFSGPGALALVETAASFALDFRELTSTGFDDP